VFPRAEQVVANLVSQCAPERASEKRISERCEQVRGRVPSAPDQGGMTPTCAGARCRDKIIEHWTPRLDGKRTVAEALSALVHAFK
jgi:hypothetical protein